MAKKHVKQIALNEPYPAFFHRIHGAARQLGWQFVADTGTVIQLQTPMNLSSWGEDITITLIDNEHIELKSQCRLVTQVIDWGRNRKNLEKLLAKVGY